ncbi:MAG: amidohydrolase [Clostridia bacterium]|jgi:aminobenzoyl-glutamate utilization protein A|nr:amidohydrolase [Clostridia bacterium]MCI2000846.1 amidohydrolase [Clostridia bacterium]MCI2015362.1 amidohydrolase [Clostridia bacterium]
MKLKFINENIKNEMISARRDMHMYPETAFTEYRTTYKIYEKLTKLGYNVTYGKDFLDDKNRWHPDKEYDEMCIKRAKKEGVPEEFLSKIKGGFTGLAAEMSLEKEGKTKVLRFDIDALKIKESSKDTHIPAIEGFKSKHEGLMHACGHDGHTAAGIGVAEAIAQNKEKFTGKIRLLFQPAEEGTMGAKCLLKWIDDADFCIGGHIGICAQNLGEIDVISDFFATSKIDVEFTGRASHAGIAPEKGINALWAAAVLTASAYDIRRPDFGITGINVGTLEGGTARNIVADHAFLQAETRGQNTLLNDYMKDEFIKLAKRCESAYGAKADIRIAGEGVSESTSEELIPIAQKAAEDMGLGDKFLNGKSFGASEDFSILAQHIQEKGGRSLYMAFGGNLKGEHHTPDFDFDEKTILIFAETLCRIAENL